MRATACATSSRVNLSPINIAALLARAVFQLLRGHTEANGPSRVGRERYPMDCWNRRASSNIHKERSHVAQSIHVVGRAWPLVLSLAESRLTKALKLVVAWPDGLAQQVPGDAVGHGAGRGQLRLRTRAGACVGAPRHQPPTEMNERRDRAQPERAANRASRAALSTLLPIWRALRPAKGDPLPGAHLTTLEEQSRAQVRPNA
jgi:hypothetical protein